MTKLHCLCVLSTLRRACVCLLAPLLLIAQSAFAVVENPTGTLVAESNDGAIIYRVFDSDGDLVFDVEVTGATSGNGVYLDIDTIDSTAASSPGSIVVDQSASTTTTVTNSNAGTLTRPEWPPLSFDGIENLTGGTGSDTFIVNANLSGVIDGGPGTDTIVGASSSNSFVIGAPNGGSINTTLFSNVENLTGGADSDTFNLNTADFGGTINGGAGVDNFNINASQSGQLSGGEGSDIFVMAVGVALTLSGTAIDGGPDAAGDDIDSLDVSGAGLGALAVNLTGSTANTGFAGTEGTVFTGAGGGFDGIDMIAGNGDETLTGLDVASIWTQTTYADGTELLTFNGMATAIAGVAGTQTLEGDDGGVDTADSFETTGSGLVTLNGQDFQNIDALDGGQGSSEVDTFNLNTSDFGGTVNGGAGVDSFNINVSQSGVLDGGEGSDTFTLANGAVLTFSGTAIDGGVDVAGDDADTLEFAVAGAGITINITSINAGTEPTVFTGAGGSFARIQNLTGSNGADIFNVLDGGSFGVIDGGADSDTVSYAAKNSAVAVSLSDLVNIENVVGSSSGDTFILGGSFSGSIDGGAGADNLVGTADANTFMLTAPQQGSVDGIAFINIASLDGAGGSDTIIGSANVNTFIVNALDAGTALFTSFVNVENLVGGGANDTFMFNAVLSGSASGGGGDDVFDLAANLVVTINGGAGNDEVVINGPNTNDLDISNVETITFVPDQVIFRVQGLVNFVSPELADAFSIGDNYDLIYTFEATTPDSTGSGSIGNFDAVLSVEIKVGSYSAYFSSFSTNRITVQNNVSGFDRYRVDLSGISGPSAAGLPLSDQFPALLLTDFSETAFADDTLPVNALDLNDFGVNTFLALFFRLPDESNALVQASVDSFDVIQSFREVPVSYWASRFVTKLAANGISGGCGFANFCPDDPVTRAQMAVFLERGMRGGDFSPPSASGNVFFDVAANDFAAAFIEQLANDGITGGCGGGNYCPNNNVTRAQMAVFLLRAKYGPGYSPPPAQGLFGDVDLSYWAVNWIEQLAAEGITSGCGGGNFCPDQPATRAQMAVFLVRTFDL